MIKVSIAFVLAGSAMLANMAHAQTSSFSHFDKDKNGRITVGEISHQRDNEIIAAMDVNADGGITPEEWRTQGRGSSYVDKGGVNDRGVNQRWVEFNIVFFKFENDVISTNWTQGQVPIPVDANPEDIADVTKTLEARFKSPPENLPRPVVILQTSPIS